MGILLRDVHRHSVIPQYLFHPRPVKHAIHFQLPIVEGMQLVTKWQQVRRGLDKSGVMLVPIDEQTSWIEQNV